MPSGSISYSMKIIPAIPLFLLCVVLVLAAGCTGRTETALPPLVTEQTVPETTALPVPETTFLPGTPETAGTAVPAVTATTVPAPDPADVQKITFLRYSDSIFSVDYPDTWSVTASTYVPGYCPESYGHGGAQCFANPLKSIGPFYYEYNENMFKPDAQVVLFTSADGRLKFSAFIRDYVDNPGVYRINPDLAWTKDEFRKMYPDLFPTNYLGNYQYSRSGNAMVASYDARLPEGYYPGAYTKKVIVTLHYAHSFAFISGREDADTYRDLNQRIMQSIETKDRS